MIGAGLLSNPWVLLAAGAALAGSHLHAYTVGARHERNEIIAERSEREKVIKDVREAALKGAAEAIAGIEVKQVTIRQTLEREIHEKPVYRDCRHDPVGLRLLNDALAGTGPTGGGELPHAGGPVQ